MNVIAGLLGATFVAVIVYGMGGGYGVGMVREQAIERGYGLHCPTTGDFAWKGECNERDD